MTRPVLIASVFIAACALLVAWGAWCQRRNRRAVNEMARERRRESLPRQQRVTYAPPVPLTPDQEDELAALEFAYRYVNIPEPDERSSR